MNATGTLHAVEVNEARADGLRRTIRRMGAEFAEIRVTDAQTLEAGDSYDRVLVDPPCSGLGTLRTHPDLRWRATPEAIEVLRREQEAIVDVARTLLKPGGRLVYSTCTLSPREELVTGGTVERTLPHRDGTDGFYIAVSDGDV